MERLLDSLQGYLSSISGSEKLWAAEAFIVVFITLLVAFVIKLLVDQLEKRAKKTTNLWDDAFCASIRRPARWMVWLVGLSLAAQIASRYSESIILSSVEHFRYLGAVIVVTWFLVGFISRVEKNFMSPEYCQKPMDQTTASAVGKLLRISVLVTSILIVLQYFDVQISGILAFGGIGGIAVGFAAKDLLANFFGGLMIYLDRPFAVGDWVRSPDQNIEGTVEDIGWRLTRIRTFDKRPLYVPNSTFTQISVENPSRMTNRRIKETIGIRYDDVAKMESIVAEVKEMLEKHDAIAQDKTLMVNFNAFAASSLDFFIYCFTKTTNWTEYHVVKQDVLLKIIHIIEGQGAQCAFPTQTVHFPDVIQHASAVTRGE